MARKTAILFILGIFATQFVTVLSLPIVESSSLTRRGGDGVYLTDCESFGTHTFWSQFSYYTNFALSQSGQYPDDTAITTNSDGTSPWEGNQICQTFTDTGVQFCSYINSNGLGLVRVFP